MTGSTNNKEQQSDSQTTFNQQGQQVVEDQTNVIGDIYQEHRHYVLSALDRQNRERMLEQVRDLWIGGVLEKSLYQCGYAPWRYVRFLDYAAERLLLRRVGGSYLFVYRMLLEHFAGADNFNAEAQRF